MRTQSRSCTLILALAGATVAAVCGCGSPSSSAPRGIVGQARALSLAQAGFIDVTAAPYAADKTGATDATDAIQQAMNDARAATKVVYLPLGSYRVSNTLTGRQELSSACGGSHDGSNTFVVVGERGLAGERPKLVLVDGAAGFDDPSKPRPLIHIWKDRVNSINGSTLIEGEYAACAFGHGFRGIDLDLGTGNSGAVGILFDAAQDSFLEDVTIEAGGAFAGVTGVPGRGTAIANIKIIGGRYGYRSKNPLTAESTGLGASLVGWTLIGQTERAIYTSTMRGSLAITGFRIEATNGPVIETVNAGNSYQSGHVALHDGVIELQNAGVALDNNAGRMVVMREVYLRRAATVVDNPGSGDLAGVGGGWLRVDSYANCPADIDGHPCRNLIDGAAGSDETVQTTPVAAGPPADIVTRHIWTGPPSLSDPELLDATAAPYAATPDDAADDDATAIQAAIDAAHAGGKAGVFLPAGVYHLGGPITLHATTQLFGVPGRRSVLHAKDAWVATLSATNPGWVIETDDDATATTTLEHVVTSWRNGSSAGEGGGLWIGAVRWRAGRHSVMRAVRAGRSAGRWEDTARQMYRVEGSGGGRWYSWIDHVNIVQDAVATHDAGFRKLVIEGTHEPLTIYGVNPEHGGEPERVVNAAFVELNGAANVRLLGMKAEANGPVIRLADTSNFYLGVGWVHGGAASPAPMVTVESPSDAVAFNILGWQSSAGVPPLVKESGFGPAEGTNRQQLLGSYRRGTLDWSAWAVAAQSTGDAGPDSGDGGAAADATIARDGGGASGGDAGADAGSTPPSAEGGCGCRVADPSAGAPWLWVLLALLLCRRRRAR